MYIVTKNTPYPLFVSFFFLHLKASWQSQTNIFDSSGQSIYLFIFSFFDGLLNPQSYLEPCHECRKKRHRLWKRKGMLARLILARTNLKRTQTQSYFRQLAINVKNTLIDPLKKQFYGNFRCILIFTKMSVVSFRILLHLRFVNQGQKISRFGPQKFLSQMHEYNICLLNLKVGLYCVITVIHLY